MRLTDETKGKCSTIVDALFIFLPVLLLGVFFVFMYKYANRLITSDDSSELILAKLLSGEGKILTKDWYYSTELRVFNTQLVFAPLFLIFKSWHAVRVVGSTILLIILEAGTAFFGIQAGLGKRWTCLLCSAMILPLSDAYFRFVMFGSYYVPHIFVSFVTFGLVFYFCSGKKNNLRYVSFGIAMLLAVLAGMGGLRQLLVLYIPLFLTPIAMRYLYYKHQMNETGNSLAETGTADAAVKKISETMLLKLKRMFVIGTATFLTAGVGYCINSSVLNGMYKFTKWNDLQYSGFSINGFIGVINSFICFFGYRTGKPLLSLALIINAFSFTLVIITILAIVDSVKKDTVFEQKALSVFLLVAIIAFTVLCSFTNFGSPTARYSYPIFVFVLPILLLYLCRINNSIKTRSKRRIVSVLLILGIFLMGVGTYYVEKPGSANQYDTLSICKILLHSNCKNIYSSYWNGNIFSELSNGKIDCRVWADSTNIDYFNRINNVDETYRWLQMVDHNKTSPRGKVACVFSSSENNSLLAQRMRNAEKIYSSNEYTVYIFDSYLNMKEMAGKQ